MAPLDGEYVENVTPVNGRPFVKVARSKAADVELALDAAHDAQPRWGLASTTERSNLLLKIADRMEQHLEEVAVAETWDNGKPVRETLAADLPLAVDHFRYFAGAIRAQEGSIGEIDHDTVAYHYHELGCCRADHPVELPAADGGLEARAGVGRGQQRCVEAGGETPASIMKLMEIVGVLPDGVLNVVNGSGPEAGKALALSPRIAKIAFTGSTETGRLIMQYATENLIPVTLELGGKSPNVFLPDVMAADDEFLDKAVEGFVMFALNQGEVRTCPSRALIHRSIYDEFMARALKRVESIVSGDPLDPATMIGTQQARSNWRRSSATSTSAPPKVRGCSPVATAGSSPAWKTAITSSRPSSRAATGFSKRRSSARWCPSPRSRTSTRPWTSPTTRCSGWVPGLVARRRRRVPHRTRDPGRSGLG